MVNLRPSSSKGYVQPFDQTWRLVIVAQRWPSIRKAAKVGRRLTA
jgi:hypothetical protein